MPRTSASAWPRNAIRQAGGRARTPRIFARSSTATTPRAAAAADQIARERLPVLVGLAHPQHHRSSTRSPSSVKPHATSTPSFGPSRRTARNVASKTTRPGRRRRGRGAGTARSARAGRCRSVMRSIWRACRAPPARTATRHRASRPAHERADHHRPQRLRAQQLGAAREQPGDDRLGGRSDLHQLHRKLTLGGLHPARPEPVTQARRRLRPPLIPGATQPRVELLLDRALDDQPDAELGEL
jgi:hypothetical protein